MRIDNLLRQLGGDDERARSEARQLLPRESVDIIPRLIPLLCSDNAPVWNAAFKVLADFANEVSVPGREAERLAVTDYLMPLLAPDHPDAIKMRALRLLPLVLPEGYDTSPIAVLLSSPDENLREKARVALQESGTQKAVQALCSALETADPPFQVAILLALSRMQAEVSLPAIEAQLESSEPALRAAAALALAWSGKPRYLTALRNVRDAADDTTAFTAGDALLRLIDAMAARGGNWPRVMAAYREMLGAATNPVLKSAAITGLGRYGDETVVPDILAALQGEDAPDLEAAALAAFESLQGAVATETLLAAYPQVAPELQAGLLGVFGRKQDSAFLGLIEAEAKNPEPAIRRAALDALIMSDSPVAVPGLEALAQSGDEEKAIATVGLQRLAAAFRGKGQAEAAGKAYLALYRVAEDEDLRQEALEGIKTYPVPEAFEVVLDAVAGEDAEKLPVGMLAGIAAAMMDAGRNDEADRLIAHLLPRANSTEAVRDALQFLGGRPGAGALAQKLGFVTAWHVIGPFPWKMDEGFSIRHVNEPEIDLNATFDLNGTALGWQAHRTEDVNGTVNLHWLLGAVDHAIGYAVARIEVPEACDAVLRMSSDDGLKVWVNGEAVHENNVDRGGMLDQDQVPAALKAGNNTILVACTQNLGGWNFALRITRPDGVVLPFKQAE
jgi:HEAT repeat protein